MSDSNPSLRDRRLGPLAVAWVMGSDLRPYRIPFIRRLASTSGISVSLFPTEAKVGSGAPSDAVSVPEGVTVQNMTAVYWPNAGLRVAWLRGTLRILRGGFDVVVCPENVHNLSVWVIAVLHRLFGMRFVLHGHGKPTRFEQARWVARLRHIARQLLLRRADAIIAYSARGRADTIAMGIDSGRVFVAQNTLDIEELRAAVTRPRSGSGGRSRQDLGLAARPTALFVGRLQRIKRVDILIQALRAERARGLECDLVVIGDGPERVRLESMASDMAGVEFLGEMYDVGALAPYFATADVLAIPGRVGLTCVHGFAYGLPVVTTDERIVSQSPEFDYVEDGYNAVVVGELSAKAFGRALSDVILDAAKLTLLSDGANSTADELDMSRMVDGFLAALEYAASRRQTAL